jgi:hypothetical protein
VEYSSTLKMEATWSSETSVDFKLTIRCNFRIDITLHNNRCENPKSYMESNFPLRIPSCIGYRYWNWESLHTIDINLLIKVYNLFWK